MLETNKRLARRRMTRLVLALLELPKIMEYKGKLYGKLSRRLIPLMLTSEDVDRMDRTNADLVVQANRLESALKYASIEIAELRHQIRETLMENLHLADGDDSTLKRLKDAISFELEDSRENAIGEARADNATSPPHKTL